MIDGFTAAQIIGGLVGLLVISYGAFFAWLVTGIHRLDVKIDKRTGELGVDLTGRLNRLDTRIEALTVAVSRLEGAVYHGVAGPARVRSE
jgi:hypothetical protein